VHFGRHPTSRQPPGDVASAEAYTNLSTSNKMLQQELTIARKESEALRVALEAAEGRVASGPLAARLEETTRELALLRASQARLQADGAAAPAAADGGPRRTEIEGELATSLRTSTQLQEENARLRRELDQARFENSGLAERLRSATVENERSQATFGQLNAELVAQREARARAEQATAAARAQLATVVARSTPIPEDAPAKVPEIQPPIVSGLHLARLPSAGSSATVELRTNPDRIDSRAMSAGATRRTHVVQAGDTLDQLARHYYRDPGGWRLIYEANIPLLGQGQPLQIGMTLEIPAP